MLVPDGLVEAEAQQLIGERVGPDDGAGGVDHGDEVGEAIEGLRRPAGRSAGAEAASPQASTWATLCQGELRQNGRGKRRNESFGPPSTAGSVAERHRCARSVVQIRFTKRSGTPANRRGPGKRPGEGSGGAVVGDPRAGRRPGLGRPAAVPPELDADRDQREEHDDDHEDVDAVADPRRTLARASSRAG